MKSMRWIGLWICIMLTGTQLLSAQSDHRNLEKYWLYRQRLLELFVKVGPGPGEGMPASEIDQFREVFGNFGVTWRQSDGTITLGWYIAVLATEYELLKRNGYPTAENEEELYYALNALWRVDAQSDYYDYTTGNWPACTTLLAGAPAGPMTATDYDDDNLLDGFAVRSDAPAGFHANFPGMDNEISEVLTAWGHNCRAKEMSQDQAIFLLMGLMAVKKWVDPSVVWNGVPLRTFAIHEGMRIVNMMRSPPRNDWTMRNPVTDSVVPIGASGIGWSYPKAMMGEALNGLPGSFLSGNTNPLWVAQGVPVTFGNEMTLGMAGAMAAIGNSWGDQTAACLNRYAVPSTPTQQGRDREIFYAYHHLMYGSPLEDTHISAAIYKALLDVAPCDGPHSTWPNPSPFYGWNTDGRFTGKVWTRADLDQDGDKELYNQFIAGQQGTCKSDGTGDMYSGLDYMLLFNLYYLMYDGTAYDPEGEWENLLHARLNGLCNDQMSTLQLLTFPNPSAGKFQIRLRFPLASKVKIELSRSNGQVLGTIFESPNKLKDELLESFDLSHLAAGLYIVTARTETDQMHGMISIVR